MHKSSGKSAKTLHIPKDAVSSYATIIMSLCTLLGSSNQLVLDLHGCCLLVTPPFFLYKPQLNHFPINFHSEKSCPPRLKTSSFRCYTARYGTRTKKE